MNQIASMGLRLRKGQAHASHRPQTLGLILGKKVEVRGCARAVPLNYTFRSDLIV